MLSSDENIEYKLDVQYYTRFLIALRYASISKKIVFSLEDLPNYSDVQVIFLVLVFSNTF
jgi:hypothetical protein